MRTRSQKWLIGAISTLLLSFTTASADERFAANQTGFGFSTTAVSAPGGTLQANHSRRGAFSRIGQIIDPHPAARRAIVGILGPLGLVVDHSSGLPRVRGLSLSPNDALTLEASGSIGNGFDDMRGQLSLHLSF